MTSFAEPKRLSDLLIVELSHLSRSVVTFVAATAFSMGEVLGRVLLGAATSAAKTGGNTGNGTLVLDADAPILAGAKAGTYLVRIIRAAVAGVATTPVVPAQKALAALHAPDGSVIELFEVDASAGTTVEKQLSFVLTEGATPFAVGDGFDIVIAAGSGRYAPLDPDAVDGSQIAAAVAAQDVAASDSAPKGVVIEYVASVESSTLVWPTGISAGEKATAIQQLEERFVFLKTGI